MRKRVKLLDCTLGLGGELISWQYGEDKIPSMLTLLQRSRVDIIEYGVLSKYTKGPHFSIYTNTLLPPFIEKRDHQSYALLLDPMGIYPDYSQLPKKSGETADIVRVVVTQERFEADLTNCKVLKEKGYQIYALIEETAQYEADFLERLLCLVNDVGPDACFLSDTSGVMSERELREDLTLFDRVLSPEIAIGLDVKNNLGIALKLAEAFCTLPVERNLILNASVGGIGLGQCRLSTAEITEWMNEEYGMGYDKCVLDFVMTYLENYLAPKSDPCAVMLYSAAAKNRCSYQYVEYYSTLGVEADVQVGALEEIKRGNAFVYNKHAANRALLNYRKKHLNMIIIVPTSDHDEAIEHLLYITAADLLKFGVDLLIYDSSRDERTHAVTRNYQIDGDNNVLYQRCDIPGGACSDEAMISVFRTYQNYDYIWVVRDGWIPCFHLFYNEFLAFAKKKTDIVAVDWSGRNQGRRSTKEYTDCVTFFEENAARVKRPGCMIYSGAFAKKLLENHALDRDYRGFWLPASAFRQIAEEPAAMGLLVSQVFYPNPKLKKDEPVDEMIERWGEDWYQVVTELPAIYNPVKSAALRAYTEDFRPFNMKSMFELRAKGEYNLDVYKKEKELFSKVSDNSEMKFLIPAVTAKGIAKLAVRLGDYKKEHTDSRFSRFVDKTRSLYVRIRR